MLTATSSEDEDDMYNSVARLKALQKQIVVQSPEIDKIEVKEETRKIQSTLSAQSQACVARRTRASKNRPKPETYPTKPSNKQRQSRQKKQTCTESYNSDSDLEIVSVEETINVSEKIPDTSNNYQNDVIVIHDDNSDSNDDEDYEMNVKVLWKSKTVHRLNIHRSENFQKIFQHFADLENVSVDQILITKNNHTINITDTPSFIGLSVIDILEGGIVHANMIPFGGHSSEQTEGDENICKIKIQTSSKQNFTIPIKKDQKFKSVIINCAKQLNTKESNIKLYLDGEKINPKDTPESLDIENEACVDLRISTN